MKNTSVLPLSFFALVRTVASAQNPTPLPFVNPIFGDNMVLQRGKPNTIWGWTQPGDNVRLEIGGNLTNTIAGADGRWQARIQPPPAGGPYSLKISGRQSVELHDLLVGDVWICGGQSNMQFPLVQARNSEAEIRSASYPRIRYFVVSQHSAYFQSEVPRGSWKPMTPETVGGRGGISAVAYFFARRLQAASPFRTDDWPLITEGRTIH